MRYKIGWPFWTLAYKLGATLTFTYRVFKDQHINRYCAYSYDVNGALADAPDVNMVKSQMNDYVLNYIGYNVYGSQDKRIKDRIDKNRVKAYCIIEPSKF